MKKSGFITVAAIAVFLLLGATWASALDPIPQESGFSGFLSLGGGYNYVVTDKETGRQLEVDQIMDSLVGPDLDLSL